MKTNSCLKWFITLFMLLMIVVNAFSQAPVPPIPPAPTITGPMDPVTMLPAPLDFGVTPLQVYTTEPGKTNYVWVVSSAGTITAPADPTVSNSITVTWTNPIIQQTVSVTYTDPLLGLSGTTVFTIAYAPVPSVKGPLDSQGLPATIGNGITANQVYFTVPGMTGYSWSTSPAGSVAPGNGPDQIKVNWNSPVGQQTVSVTYTDQSGLSVGPIVLIVNYFPFLASIDPTTIAQFITPLPHFAAGLRVNAKSGGNLVIQAVKVQQVALPNGTVLPTGTIGDPLTPNAGMGNYAAYRISKDNGTTFGPAMWPAQTIEAQQGFPLTVQYQNELVGVKYSDFNILADQTLMMNGYDVINPLTEPYTGDIPMVVHLHGGEMPSNSDGGPTAWFTPKYAKLGPGFKFNASSLSTYPNQQEATTLWYHPHDQGCTRINVYTGLAGYYFIRGAAEETAKLPGWSGDDKVQEATPAGRTATFNGTNTYLPEVEIAIQDRMFNVNGELYWPVAPTNPDTHPFWTPEFFGDIMTVNGKVWPYLSVAPRKYRFRMLEGCNARFLNMWLMNLATVPSTYGPVITVIGTDGGLLDVPAVLDPALGKTLFMAPGERFDVVIDFTGVAAGTVFTLMNDAAAPYPTGSPVTAGTTDRIMQFVVNGTMLTSTGTPGTDKSFLPANLRTANPMVKLTDFKGNLTGGVTPLVKRQIILNEVTGPGGPVAVLFNNSHFDAGTPLAGQPFEFGGPTEIPLEGSTELISIINTTIDAHPIHIHLVQWQLVSRQAFNTANYAAAYSAAWAGNSSGYPIWPAGLGYPGGSGSPLPYNTINGDGAVGGNPAISPFLTGPVMPANPEEMGWKDDIKSFPGEVATYVVRYAPTDKPINSAMKDLIFPFDPSLGPGYVWHCHIVDHEDMDMMRPLVIMPNSIRFPQISAQPAPVMACDGQAGIFSVKATSVTPITYQWEVSPDGVTFTKLADGPSYSGAKTASLKIQPAILSLSTTLYRVVLTNIDGVTTSNAALLTVNPLPVPTLTSDPGTSICRLAIVTYTTEFGQTNYVWTIPGKSGTDYAILSGGTKTANSLRLIWLSLGSKNVGVNYTNLNGCTAVAPVLATISVVKILPGMPGNFTTFSGRVKQGQTNVIYTVPFIPDVTYNWTYWGKGATITGGTTNSVLVSFSSTATSGTLLVTISNGCGMSLPRALFIIVDKVT
ncbi:MAG: multicopper oxidase domain-containing protein, partial [Mariniphaga sp.]